MAVTDATFPFAVLRAATPVVAVFTAEWCSTCRRLHAQLGELAADLADRAQVVTVDVERSVATADRYQVRGLPTLVLFDRGQERARVAGTARTDAILAGLGLAATPAT
jgi:thioredoxin 1